LFILPMFFFTPDATKGLPIGPAVREGLSELKSTLFEVRKRVGIFRFLIARMIYQDGVNAVLALGGTFAAGMLHWSISETGMFGTAAERAYILYGLRVGLAFGPVQASSRSYMARSVTAAESGRYFGIYALAGRATSFLAPFLVSTITLASGSARLGMAVIALF